MHVLMVCQLGVEVNECPSYRRQMCESFDDCVAPLALLHPNSRPSSPPCHITRSYWSQCIGLNSQRVMETGQTKLGGEGPRSEGSQYAKYH